MVGKLLKWELKATSKWFLLMYMVVVLTSLLALGLDALLNSGIALFDNSLWSTVSVMGYVLFFLSIVAVGILTFVLVAIRFYRNMTGDEGYLMHTLPVKTWQHITSKLLIAMMWNFLSVIVILSGIVLAFSRMHILGAIKQAYDALLNEGVHLTTWIILGIILTIVYLASNILTYYASIATGPVLVKNHRLGGSIVAYILIYIASQIVGFVVLFAFEATIFNKLGLGSDFEYTYNSGESLDMINAHVVNGTVATVYVALFMLSAIMIAGCYFLTHYMMQKKLNLP
jgi:hypothetical protein